MDNLEQLKGNSSVLRIFTSRLQLKQDGKHYVGHCPFHPGDNQASLKINQVDGKYLFRCFGCGAAGSIIDFISKFDKCTVNEAIKKIKEFNSGSFEEKRKEVEQVFKPITEKKPAITIPLSAYEKFEQALSESKEAKEWLNGRGISYETARQVRVGYRRDIGRLAGDSNADISEGGWLTFPNIRNGVATSIRYRSIKKKAFSRQPGMATEIWGSENISPLEAVYVCEGEIDTLSFLQLGLIAVSIPSASFKLTPEMKADLHGASEIILAGDSDSSGQVAMTKLWAELANHTYLLKWPTGMKDANQTLLEHCKGDLSAFRTLVDELTTRAKSEPIQHVYSVAEALLTAPVTASNDPRRLHFPWPSVDDMLLIMPGNVVTITASQTKTGKTTFLMNVLVYGTRKHDEVAMHYICEATPDQYYNMVAAHLTQKDRTQVTKEDRERASKLMGDARLYVGQNPSLNRVGPVLDFIEKSIQVLGPTIVVIDHIHFITRHEADTIKAQEDAFQRIVAMAKKYSVKFIVVGQPRKPDQQHKNKPMQIYDFKGSEVFESDPDGIYILHRELKKGMENPEMAVSDPYEPETTIRAIGRELAGGNTTAKLWCVGRTATFTEMIKTEPGPTSLFKENDDQGI
jgi:hypothetical protein